MPKQGAYKFFFRKIDINLIFIIELMDFVMTIEFAMKNRSYL